MKERYLIVDFLKGYAIFAIIIYHTLQFFPLPSPWDKAIGFGGSGIHTFFLVSGFGLCLSSQKSIKYFDFLKKRFDKIYLPYIIVVVFSALVGLAIPIFDNPSWYAFFGHVFLYKMFDNAITISYGHQLWFISTIIQFYLFFPLLMLLLNKVSLKFFVAVGLVLSVCWSLLVFLLDKSDLRIWNSFFLQFIWEFMLGMALAKLKDKSFINKNYRLSALFIISVLALGLQVVLTLKGGPVGQLFNDIPGLIGFTGFAVLIFNLRIPLVNKFFLFTGKISYALYLLHVLVINILVYFLSTQLNLAIVLIIAFIVNYLLSIFYSNFISYLYTLTTNRKNDIQNLVKQ